MHHQWTDEEFKKSSFSGVTKNLCVEVAIRHEKVAVRNSRARDAVVEFTPDEWRAFIAGVKQDEFNN